MGNLTNEENWAARERLRAVELWLWWRGWVGRGDLVERFGISAAQASGDLQKYLEMNGKGVSYQTSRKRYEADEDFACALQVPSLEEAVRMFLGGGGREAGICGNAEGNDQVAILQLLKRVAPLEIARRVFVALLGGKRLRVFYHSVNSDRAEWRYLRPGALAWDGRRWHARAWCEKREEWRDFVLGRIGKADWPEVYEGTMPLDDDWHAWETLRLRLNPLLGDEARASLKLDYGIEGEVIEMKVRRALRGYFLAEMYLDAEGGKVLPPHFVLGGDGR